MIFSVGDYFGRGKNKKKILDVIRLSNGWYLLKTTNSKSKNDFKVKTVYQITPRIRSYTPKHAHFAIDFYGKLCADKEKALTLLSAIFQVWRRESRVDSIIDQHAQSLSTLPGYSIEYILYALDWILEQEDVNYMGRGPEKQKALDELTNAFGVEVPRDRLGSQLAISLLCDIALGTHPVEALMKANLDILPSKRAKGAK